MRIVAIAAAHQPFVHLVMKRLGEVRLDVGMASIAERRLRGLEKVCFFLEGVNAVAIHAAHIGFAVRRAREVGVIALMAGQAFLVDLIGAGLGETEDLGGSPPPSTCALPGTVAAFAGGCVSAMHVGDPGVRIAVEALRDLGVTGFANFRPDKVGGIRGCFVGCGCRAAWARPWLAPWDQPRRRRKRAQMHSESLREAGHGNDKRTLFLT